MRIFGIYIRRVAGHSMEPTLNEGQIVIFKKATFQINSIVLLQIDDKEYVKRIVRIEEQGCKIWLEGDNKNANHNLVASRGDIIAVLIWPKTV